jgi:hypothetical protein
MPRSVQTMRTQMSDAYWWRQSGQVSQKAGFRSYNQERAATKRRRKARRRRRKKV